MAIQATTDFIYNYGTYTNPYFRIVTHLPVSGDQTPVDCFMYPSKDAYLDGAGHLACFPFYVSNSLASSDNSADNVVNKYLLFVTEQIIGSLLEISPETTFDIVEIPTI
jgi:hypothetical protein